MFEKTLRALEQIEQINGQHTYTMAIEADEEGYYDKECPNSECLFKFKVLAQDWRDLFSDDAVYCPFCGHSAPSKSWWTTEQIEQAKAQAINKVKGIIGDALRSDATSFNRQNNRGFIKMSMKVTGLSHYVDVPALALKEMEQKIACEKCGAHYAVIGSAFYCPCCGHNSAEQTFINAIEKVNAKMKNLDLIRSAVAQYSKDDAERTYLSLLESSIRDLVVAFQRLCECVYPQLPNAKPLKKNVFQRLADGNSLWVDLLGEGYEDWVSAKESDSLKVCFQQRHILQHKEGIVDQEYIDKSNDSTYKIGQHIIVKPAAIVLYSKIVMKLGKKILSLLK